MSRQISLNKSGTRIDRVLKMRVNASGYLPRRMEWDGRNWLVCPVVALTEGVIRGALADGNEFIPAEELIAQPWNGRPVSWYHPEESDGYSVNNLEAYARIQIGLLFNMNVGTTTTQMGMTVPALKGEMWFDLDKIGRLDQAVQDDIKNLEQGIAMDVSTGYWAYGFDEPGEWNGEKYETVIRFIQPDHLALLPGERGACSWTDGCGTPRVNVSKKRGGDDVKVNEAARKAIRDMRQQRAKLHASPDASVNAEGLSSIYYAVDQQLEERYGWDGFWISDVYTVGKNGTTGYVIFTRVEYKKMQSDYTIGADGKAVLSEPIEVTEKVDVTYQPVVNTLPVAPANTQPSSPASEPQQNAGDCGCGKGMNMKNDLIAKVIKASNGAFTNADTAILEKMSEAALQALAKSYEPEAKTEVVVTNTAPAAPAAPAANSLDYDEIAARVAANMERKELLEKVGRNSKLSAEVLEATPTEVLRTMLPVEQSTNTGAQVNYAALGGGAAPMQTQNGEAQPRVLLNKAQRDAAKAKA